MKNQSSISSRSKAKKRGGSTRRVGRPRKDERRIQTVVFS